MKKELILLGASIMSLSMSAISVNAADPAATVPAKDAIIEGFSLKDTADEKPIEFLEDKNAIVGVSETSSAVYTVPENFEGGNYDVYLQISKIASPFIGSSTPVTVSVNGGDVYVPTMREECFAPSEDDPEKSFADEMGIFRIEENVELKSGDKLSVSGIPGLEFFYEVYQSATPAIGDMYFYPAGTEVEQGFEGSTYVVKNEEKDESDPLSGLEIAWLGSSVTYGQAGGGYSMADAIEDTHSATNCYKYAISGTTLAEYHSEHCLPVDGDGFHGSYVNRMKMISKDKHFDLFIVQLSTNDATGDIPMGEISDGKELEDFDTATVIGAMEYIVKYAMDTWNCPVMFYTGTQYDSEQYGEMVKATLELQKKWDFGLIDLWNNDEMNAVSEDDYEKYMKDGIHPNRTGYVEWWTPQFEAAIIDYLK